MRKYLLHAGFLIGLFTSGEAYAVGQYMLYVTDFKGNTYQYMLSDVKSLTHNAGNLLILKNDASITKFSLNEIKRYTYKPAAVTALTDNKIEEISVNVFPNPSNGRFSINYKLSKAGNVSLTLFKPDGSVAGTLEENQVSAGNFTVTMDAPYVQEGIYILQVTTSEKNTTQKLIINPLN